VKSGSRYAPLYEHLRARREDEVTLTFAEIEGILGSPLPTSAHATSAWWSNRGKGALQAAAWVEARYHVVALDLAGERVTFRRPAPRYRIERAGETARWDGEAVRALRRHMGLNQAELAEVLGVRQQTISEWETGSYSPTRASAKHLTRVAEEAGYWTTEEQQARSPRR
jgi:DNA-binding transcriptional regulator YiaG